MIPRIGYGYDVHRTTTGEGFPLGAVWVPASFSLEAHSDGDVLIHALIDALLGALAKGDIGSYFPDDDPEFRNASGKDLLERTLPVLDEAGYRLGNLDATVIAQSPKLGPYISNIRKQLAECLGVSLDQVSVKATTHEKLGPLGKGEGVASYVTLLLIPKGDRLDQDG